MGWYRVLWGLGAASMLLAGLVTGHREFFLLCFILVLVAAGALALNLWTLLSFSYIQELSAPKTEKGRTVDLKIAIYNDKPFPFTMMEAEVEAVSPRGARTLGFSLASRDSATFLLPLACTHRGVHRVGMTRLRINDIFGLLPINYDMRKLSYYRQRELRVVPRMVELPYLPGSPRDAKYPGGDRVLTAEEGESYAEMREYRPGDAAKRIHWKGTARHRELLVKRYEVPREPGAAVVLDTTPGRLEGEERELCADLACECALAIALYSLKSGYRVHVLDATPGNPAVEAGTLRAFAQLREWLTVLSFRQEGDLAERIRGLSLGPEGIRTAYILTARADPPLREAALGLQRAGCAVRCLLLAPEEGAAEELRGIPCAGLEPGGDVALTLGELV